MAEIPIILLAAGNSSRMGQAKQLLRWGNKTVIEHQIETLAQTGNQVFVVLGANYDKILPFAKKQNVRIIFNLEWENGMGSSVAAGVKKVTLEIPYTDAVLLVLIDQPLISLSHFNLLLAEYHTGIQCIVASHSGQGWIGAPAIFDKYYFDELKNLNGHSGAKILLNKHISKVKTVECIDNHDDMDTFENYQKMHGHYLQTIRNAE